jgi:hypothetical protein
MDGHRGEDVFDDGRVMGARLSISKREGDMGQISFAYLIKDGAKTIVLRKDVHRLGLFDPEDFPDDARGRLRGNRGVRRPGLSRGPRKRTSSGTSCLSGANGASSRLEIMAGPARFELATPGSPPSLDRRPVLYPF